MMPTFKPGDRVITLNWLLQPICGDVIVFKHGAKKFIKRVDDVNRGLVYVSGDNKALSLEVKPFELSKCIGKVIFKF